MNSFEGEGDLWASSVVTPRVDDLLIIRVAIKEDPHIPLSFAIDQQYSEEFFVRTC